ncbi:MAG TPA: VOC family protein [Gaiellaceae bacterium]|nr:VOC family protein [Gaiellaceae bacterium]
MAISPAARPTSQARSVSPANRVTPPIGTPARVATRYPDVSIEVDDVDQVYERARAAGAEIVYPLTDEEWGLRRFFVRDPNGAVINVTEHR